MQLKTSNCGWSIKLFFLSQKGVTSHNIRSHLAHCESNATHTHRIPNSESLGDTWKAWKVPEYWYNWLEILGFVWNNLWLLVRNSWFLSGKTLLLHPAQVLVKPGLELLLIFFIKATSKICLKHICFNWLCSSLRESSEYWRHLGSAMLNAVRL